MCKAEDSGCDAGYECVPSTNCAGYRIEQQNLKSLQADSSEYKKLLRQLRGLICNKALRKICCKRGNPSTTTYKPQELGMIGINSPSWVPKPNGEGRCGIEGSNAEFIVGGEDAELGQYPWMALLGIERRGKVKWTCGGTLINKWYVLSAAHCAEKDYVRLGEWNIVDPNVHEEDSPNCFYFNDVSEQTCLDDGSRCSKFNCRKKNPNVDCKTKKQGGKSICAAEHQDIKVLREIIHPGYGYTDIGSAINDIMLLKLAEPAILNDFVRPICLPDVKTFKLFGEEGHQNINHGKAIVAGWGTTYNSSKDDTTSIASTPKLQKLEVKVLTIEECINKYSKLGLDLENHISVENQTCAGGEKDKDSCDGDSGGPLFAQANPFVPNMIVGVVSFGTGRCGKGAPGVYTRVASYRQWIEDNLV